VRIQQISQRGKEYLKAAETLLRAAQTMTDRAIAGQLKALADDCEQRTLRTLIRPKLSFVRPMKQHPADRSAAWRCVTDAEGMTPNGSSNACNVS
jgi:hypothetical protein